MTSRQQMSRDNATDRIAASPAMLPYRDLLLDEKWAAADRSHFEWVAFSDEADVLEWAEMIRRENQ
jgi:hypothetical protein